MSMYHILFLLRFSYKHLLLSKSELSEIKRINSKAGPLAIEGLDNINK